MTKANQYEHLKGKEVRYYCPIRNITGIVQHIDPEYGITIVDKDSPDNRLVCLINPEVMKLKRGIEVSVSQETYQKQFDVLAKELEKDSPYLSVDFMLNKIGEVGSVTAAQIITSDDCGFSL